MKPQYFVAILFVTSLYWMYLLYAPFLLSIVIAALLAISTSNIQTFFEKYFHSKLFASLATTLLLALLFFAPLGYFLATLTLKLNDLSPEVYKNIEASVLVFVNNPPSYLKFLQPYALESIESLNVKAMTSHLLSYSGIIGTFSANFLKNAFLVIVFYFFAHYYGHHVLEFLKRAILISAEETTALGRELSSVMSVVFYSIIVNAMFQGALFGIIISFIGYNGLLFGIMYGFASLIPIIGGSIMWIPFMLYEFSLGNNFNAIFIAIYSIVMISVVADTFLKPLIIKEINRRLLKEEDAKLNELVIFFAILAGLASFGFWGMILGPAITAFFVAIVKLFEARTKEIQEFIDRSVGNHP